jgi:hypothetical protein
MHDRVVNIETYPIGSYSISFAGTLRNEKKFELHQNVFIESHGMMHQCKIVGIELPPAENPEFRYLIEIPKELVELIDDEYYSSLGIVKDRISKTCKNIFSTVEEAKQSALKELDHKYKLNKDNIERFFKRYEQ